MAAPFAAPVPRVVRSRRDDRYQAGRPTGVKRASAGVVVASGPTTGTATVTFDAYRTSGSSTPTPITIGTDPWGDGNPATYTENRINRISSGSASGWRHYADLSADIPEGATITDMSFEADITATNGGTAPGSTLRSAFVFFGPPSAPGGTNGDYVGEFVNTGPNPAQIGIHGTGTVTGTWSDASGTGTSLAGVPVAFDGGYIRVVRYDNFVSPFSGNYTLRCNRITIVVSYEVPSADAADTVNVRMLGEVLTGVIFLRDKPDPGDIVEVEARGDLLVIPLSFPGPPVVP